MRMLATVVVTAALSTGTGAFANFGYFVPRLDVNAISGTQFEVIEARGEGARGMWCAAAQYAINQLGVERGRIYVARVRGPAQTVPGRKGVVFSTKPIGNVGPSPSVSVGQVGENLPVQHALQFCRDYDIHISDSQP